MSEISAWSTTAASNNSASPNGWPEGMAPSGVNDSARENMAAIRTWYEDVEWREWGHTVTYASATSFTTAAGDGDTTGVYVVGRRVRAVAATPGTIYGRITASSFSTTTTVTVAWDSGSLSNEALTISVGFLAQYQPMTTRGDLMTRDASGLSRLAIGTTGQLLESDGTDAAWANRRKYQSALATTSGTTATLSSVPSWVTQIDLFFTGVSSNGTAGFFLQLGTASSIETTGYNNAASTVASATPASQSSTTSQPLMGSTVAAAGAFHGHVSVSLANSGDNTWAITSSLSSAGSAATYHSHGTKALAAALTRVHFTAGGDTLDAGTIYVRWS